MRIKRFFFTLCIFTLFFIFSGCDGNSGTSSKNLFKVKKPSVITISESGQLESVNNTFILSPSDWNMEYRIAHLAKEGSFVHQGDTVVYFNTETAQSELDEALAQLEIQQEKYWEVLEQNAVSLKEKENQLQQLNLQYKINLSRVEQAKFESDVRLKEAQLELEKTILNLSKTKDNLASSKIINQKKADLVHLEIRQAEVRISRAKNKLADMILIAPKGGMVIYQRQRGMSGGGEKIKVGDSVWPRSPIMAIPDLDAMQVKVKLNEIDRPLVMEGQKANITIEAYPDSLFSGEVHSISKIVEKADGANNLKTYEMIIHLLPGTNYRLKPGLSAVAVVEIDSAKNMFEVPSWCVEERDKKFYVREKDNGEVAVKIHTLRDGKAYIKGDLAVGMELRAIF
ncbi:MAG: HlyD family efflux transporter periplasmic adaptor subunit [Calditrichaeota bacterium]|nr:MAG: HlyD family efflux transporter periplasmic adaptor subunit [Calditrichota bacterium]MBL1204798.1 HlyD family efflux transporter periplasmic adaptor subunit [Calditrichota bacterium]NOG44627.1 HlyD family efflux transporter periplasmic adaptor subunit [Calditrichota bacterium]